MKEEKEPPSSPTSIRSSLISLVVSVDVKHHVYLLLSYPLPHLLPVPNKPYSFCGR